MEAKEKELQTANSEVKAELAKHKKAIDAIAGVLLRRINSEKFELPEFHAEETSNAKNVISQAAKFLGSLGVKGVASGITSGAIATGQAAIN